MRKLKIGLKALIEKSRIQILHDVLLRRKSIQPHRALNFAGRGNAKEDIRGRYRFDGELADIFCGNQVNAVHKWHHYIPIYERYFGKWRGHPVRFLEIGVSKGGSLAMWRRYFGDDAVIFGIDIDPTCLEYDGIDGQVRIGSQTDALFLVSVVKEMGGVDVVLDDGSHVMAHIKASIESLFPLLNEEGVYMIEDLHTAYWRDFGGGYWRPGNFFNFVRDIVDDMHSWYHVSGLKHPSISEACRSVHVYDSVCVFEKQRRVMPVHSIFPS